MPTKSYNYLVSRISTYNNIRQKDQLYRISQKDNSSIDSIKNQLLSAIDQCDEKNVEDLLRQNFVTDFKTYSYSSPSCNCRTCSQNKVIDTYESYNARPVIEQLFYENNHFLKLIIQKLLDQNNPGLFQAFISSLEQTDIPHERLFIWDKPTSDILDVKILALDHYGKSLTFNNIDRGRYVTHLAETLTEKKRSAPSFLPGYDLEPKEKFQILKFKLDFLSTLHSYDSCFSEHRGLGGLGWKRVLANFATILFPPLAVANLVYTLINLRPMFFNKTNSQDKVDCIQDVIAPIHLQLRN